MQTYRKNGNRQLKLIDRKNTKQHIKGFYSTMDKLNKTISGLEPLKDIITSENVNEYSLPFMGRDLDHMETNIILSRLKGEENIN